jgi:hypothetical protein
MFQINLSVFIKKLIIKNSQNPVKSGAVFNKIERFFNKTE